MIRSQTLDQRVSRNHVRSRAAIGHNAVDSIGGSDMLAQQAEPHLRDGERIRGVNTQFRKSRGVGRFASAMNFEHGSGDDLARRMSNGAGCTIMAA
jgi:hypothetical protein